MGKERAKPKFMKKKSIVLAACIVAVLMTACSQPADVTWEELCEANRLAAVFEQTDACQVLHNGGEYIWSAAKKYGSIIWSQDNGETTTDYRDGATYRYVEDNGITAEVSFLPAGSDVMEFAEEERDLALEEWNVKGAIRLQNGKYNARLNYTNEEYGITVSGTASFDASTLLLDTLKIKFKMGVVRERFDVAVVYGTDAVFEQRSYEAIAGAEDAIDITLHDNGGNRRNYRLIAETEITVNYSYDGPGYSLCPDETCTARINDLNRVEGSHADLYMCEGEVPFAPPVMHRVLERSGYDYLFEKNYDSYGQSFVYYDGQDNWLGDMELAWILNDDSKMEFYAERINSEGEVVFSEMGTDGVWYSWSEEEGYRIDFYDDEDYAEKRMDEYRFYINEEHLAGEMQQGEYCWYVPYTQDNSDGTKNEYTYEISPDFGYIDRIRIETVDSEGVLAANTEIHIGGNGGVPVYRFIKDEITEPEDIRIITLTVSGPTGEKKLKVRADSAIGREGVPLYKDKECTQPVSDLSWVKEKFEIVYFK